MISKRPSPTRRCVYLDVCVLNRPLDDQDQMRIRLETDAVHLILGHVRAGDLELAVSPAHHVEVAANPNIARREHVQLLLKELGTDQIVDLTQARARARSFMANGIKTADAAHVALAEQAKCDFVTVDDRLLRRLDHAGTEIWFGTPMAYCDKENLR